MEMLDHANTSAFGDPTMTEVSRTIEPGPFIVVTGHDLKDLSELLEATDGTGVNGGGKLVTGCGWKSALKLVPKISELVRQGRIGGFMLVGGCDGAKAVAVLLTLLALGIRNIRLGPTAPVFVSPNVFKTLADKLGLSLI